MVNSLQWLALETKYLDRAEAFYEAFLDLETHSRRGGEVILTVGETDLVLREPGRLPRGGVHTHYALSIPAGEYDAWYEQLKQRFELVEHSFGDSQSLYFYDPDGNCVELGQADVDGPGVDGVFEVVMEVEQLGRAVDLYERLGFEVVDRGDDRRRVRMNADSFAIELWEPQLGIADARGGVHVDMGVTVEEPAKIVDKVRTDVLTIDEQEDGIRIRDVDGHYVTLVDTS
ncbi:VOC family protein [Halovenus rubra]|uniref:VOC family protein n=2 Tax=Halovenus rubra TaxID=869890 RepID=A0ACC7E096_9EURY|nr:fosmidomycin resistance protein [Halovenus rubra]